MRKKALLAMLLAASLLLSGCALIVKDQAVDDATVILKLGDRQVTKAEVLKEAQNQLDSMEYYYAAYGQSLDVTDPTVISQARTAAVDSIKKDMALTAKAKELGLDQLTPEEEEAANTSAKESFDGAMDYARNYLVEDKTLEGEALDKAAEEALTGRGVNFDVYLDSARKTQIDNKLREYAIKDVTVSEEETKAEFDSRVESDKSLYGERAGSYATAVNNGTTVYYVPAGVRRVKQILTKFKDEDQAAITEANQAVTDANSKLNTANAKVSSAEEILGTEGIEDSVRTQTEADLEAAKKEQEEANKELEQANAKLEEVTNKAFENIDADADAILAELDGGADWQKLMDEKNQDPGMQSNEKGYAVSADMSGFDPAFVEAAMALEKPGDHSGKVRGSSYGYYIIRYESDEPEGPVQFDDVKEGISSSLLTTKQNDVYDSTVDQWVQDAGITVDLNALNN